MMNHSLLFLLVLAIAGCTRGMDKAEVPGIYEFGIDNLKQQITIGADGKYSNAFYQGGALVWSDQGAWTYEEQKGKPGITFAKFRFGIPGHASEPGYWFVVPEKTLTGVKALCFDLDLDRCFRAR
jgi:hypothetical protein